MHMLKPFAQQKKKPKTLHFVFLFLWLVFYQAIVLFISVILSESPWKEAYLCPESSACGREGGGRD